MPALIIEKLLSQATLQMLKSSINKPFSPNWNVRVESISGQIFGRSAALNQHSAAEQAREKQREIRSKGQPDGVKKERSGDRPRKRKRPRDGQSKGRRWQGWVWGAHIAVKLIGELSRVFLKFARVLLFLLEACHVVSHELARQQQENHVTAV